MKIVPDNLRRTPAAGSPLLFGLALLFTGVSLAQLSLVRQGLLTPSAFAPLAALMLCAGAAMFALRRRYQYGGDPILLPLVYFLSGFGLVLIARLAPAFVTRQMIWLAAATALLLLVTLLPRNLNWLRRYKYTWLFAGLGLLAATLVFGVNPSGFGARLWLSLGNVYFQPSELLKLLLIVFLAAYLADRRAALIETNAKIGPLPVPHPAYLGPMLLMWGFSIILLIWQRDLGAALLFFGTFLGMLYAATGQLRYIWAGVLLFVVAAVIGYLMFDVVKLRVDGFLDPWQDPSGRSFQIVQSLLAFASGGVLGQGLGQGLPTAIPVVHTDFVYAAIGEEYGLVGALGVLLAFALLIGRAFHIAARARDDFEQLLAAGIGVMLGLQTIVITAGTLKLLPLTGVTLPFVSYGGSSLLVSFFMVGLLFFIAASPEPQPVQVLSRHNIFHLPLARALLTGLLVVAGGLVLWQVLLAPLLVTRRDNPRPVVAEQQIERGRLLTRGGIPVAETVTGRDGLAERRYPYPGLSSVTGYYSIRYGAGGTEAAFNLALRGALGLTERDRWINDLLHRPQVGRDVTLTIDLPAQVAADVALGEREGAVVVLDVQTGAVRVMSSHPTFDPNTLDETWDTLRQDERAPLLNRATQGLFPLGDLAGLVGLIGLHEAGAAVPPNAPALPANTLTAALGPTGFRAAAHQLGLARSLPGLPSQPGHLPDFPPAGKETARNLAVTPLHLARVVAGLDRAGRLPNPILSLQTPPTEVQAIRPDTARAVRATLPQIDAHVVGLRGVATAQETGSRPLSWFVGLAPATAVAPAAPQKSAALADDELILNPARIPPAAPTTEPPAPISPARFVVAAVVVTDAPDADAAYKLARPALDSLLN